MNLFSHLQTEAILITFYFHYNDTVAVPLLLLYTKFKLRLDYLDHETGNNFKAEAYYLLTVFICLFIYFFGNGSGSWLEAATRGVL